MPLAKRVELGLAAHENGRTARTCCLHGELAWSFDGTLGCTHGAQPNVASTPHSPNHLAASTGGLERAPRQHDHPIERSVADRHSSPRPGKELVFGNDAIAMSDKISDHVK